MNLNHAVKRSQPPICDCSSCREHPRAGFGFDPSGGGISRATRAFIACGASRDRRSARRAYFLALWELLWSDANIGACLVTAAARTLHLLTESALEAGITTTEAERFATAILRWLNGDDDRCLSYCPNHIPEALQAAIDGRAVSATRRQRLIDIESLQRERERAILA